MLADEVPLVLVKLLFMNLAVQLRQSKLFGGLGHVEASSVAEADSRNVCIGKELFIDAILLFFDDVNFLSIRNTWFQASGFFLAAKTNFFC